MIPAAANIPLTICSVVIRRFIDSYTGQVPLAVAASTVPSISTVAICSGVLLSLYHQMRRGTLVNIGISRRLTSVITNSRNTIQRRVKNNSWFLRNITACRRKCTAAMLRIARPSNDSLQHIQAETGTVVQTTSLPVFTRLAALENRRNVHCTNEPPVENIYSNDSFDSPDCSNQDIRTENPKRKQYSNRHQLDTTNRPVTRNFRKSLPETTCRESGNSLSQKKRKKSTEQLIDEAEDQPALVTRSRSEVGKHLSRKQMRKFDVDLEPEVTQSVNSRYSERKKKQLKVQKITRKTRSGRVYAYRL